MNPADARKLCRILIDRAIQSEADTNEHLGHPTDYQRGSMAVRVRWDVLAAALGYEPAMLKEVEDV